MTPEFVRQNFRVKKLHRSLVWRFYPKDKLSIAWHYRLAYLPQDRRFVASILTRQPGRQQNRRAVSDDIRDALREALPPKAVALCARESLLPWKGTNP